MAHWCISGRTGGHVTRSVAKGGVTSSWRGVPSDETVRAVLRQAIGMMIDAAVREAQAGRTPERALFG